MINDFNDNMSFVDSYDIVGIQNLTCPKITVNNDNIVIVAETNQNYNKDIICIYGTPENPQQTLITTGDSDEQYPEIEYIGNTTYVCSYISNNQLYISISPTGGMTWSNPIKIRDNIIESYKSTDLSESLDYIGYELMNDSNIDVMFDDNRLSIVYIDDDFSPSTPGWQYDHFDVIQDGIDAVAENGTVYVYNGTYFENVIVNKTIDLIGEDKNGTIIDGLHNLNVIKITSNFVNFSSFTIKNSSTNGNGFGIHLVDVNHCSIHHINVFQNFYGIELDYSCNNTISNNNISDENEYGLRLFENSNDNLVEHNMIHSNNFDGVEILNSQYNIIKNNSFVNNTQVGIRLYESGGQTNNNTIAGNTIQHNSAGMQLNRAKQNLISNNNINSNEYGIILLTTEESV